MKSGLEDRNNVCKIHVRHLPIGVSMKSGLEDRNNGTVREYCQLAGIPSQ